MGWREINCPQCGETVKIPWFWILGIEGIFYCPDCRRHLKINYKLGALLAGIGWALSFVAIQLVAWFTSALTILLAALLFIPLGFFFSFLFRRAILKRRIRKQSAK